MKLAQAGTAIDDRASGGATGLPLDAPLDWARAYVLARAEGSQLPALMLAAATLRDRHKGRIVSYSRKVFIPLANLCRNRCAYCAFARAPAHPAAQIMEPAAVLAIARAGAAQGCKEALFCLGERPEERHPSARRALDRLGYRSTVAYLAAMCALVWRETGLLPHCNCGILNMEELDALAEVSVSVGLMLESSSERLCRPGGPHYRCPGKAPAPRLATIAAAGGQGIPFTTGILIGIGETPEERVDALFAIKELQERYGHIQEVIVQNFQPHPGTPMAGHPAPAALEMLRTLALARLILGGEMNLQAPPNLAPDVYQRYLLAGSNDWGGISPVTADLINPGAAWPEIAALGRATAAAGFVLRERLAVYPEYLQRPGFVRPKLLASLQGWVDETGYVRGDVA